VATNVLGDLAALAKGFLTTSKHAFRKPVTVQYPETKLESLPRFKGRHVLKRYEDGLERCIGCSLCAGVCPADAIYVDAAENTDEARYSPGERYAEQYEINMIRCIFCGMCEEFARPRRSFWVTNTSCRATNAKISSTRRSGC
jgi:NADH-quinone oxidoreductase subunit I